MLKFHFVKLASECRLVVWNSTAAIPGPWNILKINPNGTFTRFKCLPYDLDIALDPQRRIVLHEECCNKTVYYNTNIKQIKLHLKYLLHIKSKTIALAIEDENNKNIKWNLLSINPNGLHCHISIPKDIGLQLNTKRQMVEDCSL